LFKNILALVRVKQWIKNFFVLIPLFFAGKLQDPNSIFMGLSAFFAFNFFSSIVYIINDLYDIEADRKHPRKKSRPLPAGKISMAVAIIIAIILFIFGSIIGILLNLQFSICLGLYLMLNVFYTFWGKHIVILDVLCIATGFVLRVIGGSLAILAIPSNWIMMTTFFISLFMGFGKRRNEFIFLEKNKGLHRKVLNQYDKSLLNHLIFISCSIAIISYAMYTISPSVIDKFNNGKMLIYTVPIVTFLLYRYAFILWKKDEGDPTEIVIKDIGIILSGLLWVFVTVGLIYLPWKIM